MLEMVAVALRVEKAARFTEENPKAETPAEAEIAARTVTAENFMVLQGSKMLCKTPEEIPLEPLNLLNRLETQK